MRVGVVGVNLVAIELRVLSLVGMSVFWAREGG